MKRIHGSLRRALERNRLVFWYDGAGEWDETFEAFSESDVTRLRVAGNEFGTKVRIAREPDPAARFLIYSPADKPSDRDNWLLDLLLQGHEFRADRASLILEDLGLPHEFRSLIEEHALFFGSAKRVQTLSELIAKDDELSDLRLKMMAVLAGTSAEVDALLMRFLGRGADDPLIDPVQETLGGAALTEHFWRLVERTFGYSSPSPSLRDFAVLLFRAANPLDTEITLQPQMRVFVQRWKDSQTHCESFRAWSRKLESELQIAARLEGREDPTLLGRSDAFEIFDRFTLHRLCAVFAADSPASVIRETIQARRESFWQPEHADGFAALEHALDLRELLAAAELEVESIAAGVNRYTTSWWKIDLAYRRCILHLRRYGQVQVMEKIREWVEKSYVNNYLLPLADRWSDQVRKMERWECAGLVSQRQFFATYVQPFRSRGQKVFVIISDALRYEAAAEFADRLLTENRWTTEIDAVFGALPSYTQLGMASLLPGNTREVEAENAAVSVDGRSATGTPNRAEILRSACGDKAIALQAEDFLELNTKTTGRALTREHDIIYIFHNRIDKVGDALATEARSLEAVESAFEELEQVVRKVANVNGNNMLLTADHGFLFQQDPVADGDMVPLPAAESLTYRARRFVLGHNIEPTPAMKVFDAPALGLEGDWTAAFPLGLGRFPLQGSGKRYVHGGPTLQEVVVPVVSIHKARTDDTERVEIEFMRVPAKITTGQLSVSLFQKRPVAEKVLPRTLRVGIFAPDSKLLSELKTLTFDSTQAEPRRRETSALLALSHQADAYNNQTVELRLEEAVPGTNQTVTYKSHTLKLQKPFTSDFDEF